MSKKRKKAEAPGLTRLEHKGLLFDVRPGTSDEKAFNEVVKRRNYARYDCGPHDGDEWVDLGANVGAFTVWAASLGAYVYAFEPDPEMCTMIEHNLRLNGLIGHATITQAAVVADERTEVVLHCNVARGNVWRNSIERHWQGEADIVVPAVNVKTLWRSMRHVKMDIEGTEMPILEKVAKAKVQSLVFEWSFDVDPSIPRFHAVIEKLRTVYDEVRYGGFDETADTWLPAWFPPCRMVWCK